jgi:hypothetical protein
MVSAVKKSRSTPQTARPLEPASFSVHEHSRQPYGGRNAEPSFSNCGPRTTSSPRWSAGGFSRKSSAKIVSVTERMKNTPIHVCTKITSVGWLSTESRRICSFQNFLSLSHYFTKYFEFGYRKINMIMATLTTGVMYILFTFMHLLVWGIVRKWSAHAPIA